MTLKPASFILCELKQCFGERVMERRGSRLGGRPGYLTLLKRLSSV